MLNVMLHRATAVRETRMGKRERRRATSPTPLHHRYEGKKI